VYNHESDEPIEVREERERARQAALADPDRAERDDAHSERAWEMVPKGRWHTRFEVPVPPPSQVLLARKISGAMMAGAGGAILVVSWLRGPKAPFSVLLDEYGLGAALLALGLIVVIWVVRRGPAWADRERMHEFE
jgi:hypothetical protein